jgi:hypothetical protein
MADSQVDGAEDLGVETGVSATTWEPFITVTWKETKVQLTPEQSRQHAQYLLEAAATAETDAFLIAWMRERFAVDRPEVVAGILQDFRDWRTAREEVLSAESRRSDRE